MTDGADAYDRYLKGDDGGIIEIISLYKDGLMLFLNGYCNDIYIAEELTEETFVKLATVKPKYSGKSSFKTWLYAIGKNTAVDFIRHTSHEKTVTLDNGDEISSGEDETVKTYIASENRRILYESMRKLPEEYRQVLYLSYFEDFTNEQISTIMKKSRRQIENLLYRAKVSLKLKLEKEGFVYEEQ